MYSQQIKTFVQVAERGSLSKAAEDLFVTPASVMKQMNALEERLGLTLLKRTNHGIELTEAGKYIYQSAKQMKNFNLFFDKISLSALCIISFYLCC